MQNPNAHILILRQVKKFCNNLIIYLLYYSNYNKSCLALTFDPAKHAIPKWCTGRKWHIPMASNQKKSRRRIWLTKWDKVKAHDTLIDWCTKREWPLNCMTVISAWWQSNMPFQRLSGRLNCYITRRDRKSASWRSDELETRCGRESPHPAEWASGQAALENEKDTTLMAIRVGVNILQFCSVSDSLSHANLTIKWKVFTHSLSLCRVSFCMNLYISIQHQVFDPTLIPVLQGEEPSCWSRKWAIDWNKQ